MIQHKGWNWNEVDSSSWNKVSEEFFPVAFRWKDQFHSVLDIGAGKGRHAFYFAEYGLDVSAIDLSESSVSYMEEVSKERNLPIHAQVADMIELPFDDDSFDCVICFHTIYHTDYQGVKKALSEIQRVVKNNGEAFISFNSKDNPNFVESETQDGYTIIKKDGLETEIPHCYLDVTDIFKILDSYKIVSISKVQNFVRKGRETHGIHYYVHVVNQK